jgi:general secretion pathway protein D
MTHPRRASITIVPLAAATALALVCGQAVARQEANPGRALLPDRGLPPLPGRRPIDGPPTKLSFKNVKVEQVIPFIVESTGMVVMPQPDVLSRPITVLNDQPIPREQALDLVFLALQQAGVAVVESQGVITLRDITEIDRQDVPVIGPRESVLTRGDLGTIAEKVFTLNSSTAESMGKLLKDSIPKYAKLAVDPESNQVSIMGNIALLQRMERLITSLDRPSSAALVNETFRLRYADAEQIKSNIEELFSAQQGRTGTNRNQQQNQGNRFPGFFGPGGPQGQGGQQPGGGSNPGGAQASENLRVTANTQQNSVTVVAEPTILSEVRKLIETNWDLPLPDEVVAPKIYDLQNTDPIKMRDLLQQTFGQPTGVTGGTTGTPGQQGGGTGRSSGSSSQGVGRLAGQFSFQAMPESGRLLVVAKSPDNLAVIDKIIAELDKPQTVGLPAIVELKHASAEELAEQLNTLLSQEGTLAQIRRAESGLTSAASNASPFATQTTTTTGNQTTQETTSPDLMTFWWQRARPPTDSRGSSNLVSKVRLVPVWRQNAVMVLSPPEYKNSIVQLIEQLDQPGRQVLISAIVAEISRDDATSLGLRWSSQAINPTNADNSISIGSTTQSTENRIFGNLFDTSVLNVNANLNLVLQALAQKTAVSILSEPKIFTSDNQEAEFFDGQDIPFVTDSQVNNQGNLTQSFDYRAVGIQLRARPRITPDRKVDLRVNLQLASIVPGQTLFGGFIVDRRETTTQVIVKNAQTVVISGILRSEDTDVVRKIPILADIPILGALFRSTEKTVKETELIVFITPVVVDNVDDVDSVTQPLRGPLDQLREKFKWDQKDQGAGRATGTKGG